MKIMLALNEKKVPAVRIDKSLEKHDHVVMLPKKLNKANEMLKKLNIEDVLNKKTRR
jgi:hypothetical protein